MIALGSDHVGIELKEKIIDYFNLNEIAYKDIGAFSTKRCNYPEYAYKVAKAVADGEYEKGLLFCGSGIGMSISANKVKGIRCVVCSEPYSALLSKQHNNSNILALGARVVGSELAIMIIESWLNGKFEGGRHAKRVDQIAQIETHGKIIDSEA